MQRLFVAPIAMLFATGMYAQSHPSAVGGDKFLPKSVKDLKALQDQVRTVVDKVIPATVGVGGATGVIVSEDGYVLTAAHVAKFRGDKVRITLHDGRELQGTTCGLNWDDDAALVKIADKGPWPFARLAEVGTTKPGSWCLAIGHPEGFRVGRGPVVRLGRVLLADGRSVGADVSCTAGDSGGPLFDLRGRVVGVLSSPLHVAPIRGRVSGTFGLRYASANVLRLHWDRLDKGEEWGKMNRWPQDHKIRMGYAKSNPRILSAFQPVVAEARRSTVRVRCGGKDVALGTVVGPDGWVLTRLGALTGAVEVVVGDTSHKARITGVQKDDDLAMLKIDVQGLPPVSLTADKSPQPGSWIVSSGIGDDPLGFGVVSVAPRDQRNDRDLIRPHVRLPFKTMANTKRTASGFSVQGLVVWKVLDGGETDVRTGDVILAVGSKKVPTRGAYRASRRAFSAALQTHKPGDTIKLMVRRAGKEVAAKARLEAPPPQSAGRYPLVLQHDAHVSANECGGPLVDLDGRFVGINIASTRKQYHYESYAIPAGRLRQLLFDLASGQLAPKQQTRIKK